MTGQEPTTPGWYPAPDSPGHTRYHDGTKWTHHYAARGAETSYTPDFTPPPTSAANRDDDVASTGSDGGVTDPAPAPFTSASRPPSRPVSDGDRRFPRWAIGAIAAVAAVLLIAVIAVVVGGGGDDDAGSSEGKADVKVEGQTTERDATTTEPTTTTERPATTTTSTVPLDAPLPTPVILSGNGTKALSITKPEPGPTIIVARYDGTSKFLVRSDAETLLSVTGPYEGTVLMDGFDNPGGDTKTLQVTTEGTWILEFRSARSARPFEERTSGHGSDVVRYVGPTVPLRWHHSGKSTFIVNAGTEPLIKGKGLVDETVVTPGYSLIAITADGDWTAQP